MHPLFLAKKWRTKNPSLVGGIPTPLKNMKVSWGYYSHIHIIYIWTNISQLGLLFLLVNGKDDIPYMTWKIKFMFQTTNQSRFDPCQVQYFTPFPPLTISGFFELPPRPWWPETKGNFNTMKQQWISQMRWPFWFLYYSTGLFGWHVSGKLDEGKLWETMQETLCPTVKTIIFCAPALPRKKKNLATWPHEWC